MSINSYFKVLKNQKRFLNEFFFRLAVVYVTANADIKRKCLRMVEAPIEGMGMNSPELLKLVETCPKGAETLLIRVIHILTDKRMFNFNLLIHLSRKNFYFPFFF